MKVLELLTKETWAKGSYAYDTTGTRVKADDPTAVKWCLQGALQKCYPDGEERFEAGQKINAIINKGIISFNDEATWDDVRSVLQTTGV